MLEGDRYQKNLARWELFEPIGALLLKSGSQTYAPEDSPEEAQKTFALLDLTDVGVLFVYGLGQGHLYDAAKEWLRQSLEHYLVFLEDDPAVIRNLFHTERGNEILEDRQAWICYADPQGITAQSLGIYFVLKPCAFTALPLYERTRPEHFQMIKSKVSFYITLNQGVVGEYTQSGRTFFSNFFRNLLQLPTAKLGNSLFGAFEKIPAIICGAGPSLGKNLHVVQRLRNRALIFAGGSAMNALNARGFLPHFGVALDPNPAQMSRLIMNQAFETPYLYRNRLLTEALNLLQGEHVYVTGSGGHEIARWFEEKLGIEGLNVSEGYNVTNFSTAIAHALGCDPIIFVGVDLAYTDNFSYSPGILSHPLFERKEYLRTKSANDELLNCADIYGKPTLSLWKWLAESAWFSQFAKGNPETTFINATEGGIGFKDVPNMELEKVAQSMLQKRYDLDGLVHGQMEMSSMPSSVTFEAVATCLKELSEGLLRCRERCETIRKDFNATLESIAKHEEYPENGLSHHGMEALQKLEEEKAYKHLLKVFSDINFMLHSRDFIRLKSDEGLLKKEDIAAKKTKINEASYRMLGHIATANSELINEVLNEERRRKKASASQVHPGDFSIADACHDEEFEPDPAQDVHKLYYADGSLKMLQYTREGLLDGPSTFYAPAGKVLARCWYKKGAQEGKSCFYTVQGNLSSCQTFKDGVLHGQQRYYYPDGSLKTLLDYCEGLLDGDVLLYYPEGRVKRELHFIKGARHGIERIWDEHGQLRIEAQFDMDKPVGIARRWNAQGILVKEIIYQPESSDYRIREWKDDGTMIDWTQGVSDYFDQVVIETGRLAKDLQKIVEQVVTPLVADSEQQQTLPTPTDLAKLHAELERLTEMHRQLMYETGLDAANYGESIWKSPAHQREMQRQMEKITAPLQEQMRHLEAHLKASIEKLQRKLRLDEEDKRSQ